MYGCEAWQVPGDGSHHGPRVRLSHAHSWFQALKFVGGNCRYSFLGVVHVSCNSGHLEFCDQIFALFFLLLFFFLCRSSGNNDEKDPNKCHKHSVRNEPGSDFQPSRQMHRRCTDRDASEDWGWRIFFLLVFKFRC